MGESSAKGNKPCVCQLKKTGWPWKATGAVNADNQAEYKCRICGKSHWAAA